MAGRHVLPCVIFSHFPSLISAYTLTFSTWRNTLDIHHAVINVRGWNPFRGRKNQTILCATSPKIMSKQRVLLSGSVRQKGYVTVLCRGDDSCTVICMTGPRWAGNISGKTSLWAPAPTNSTCSVTYIKEAGRTQHMGSYRTDCHSKAQHLPRAPKQSSH